MPIESYEGSCVAYLNKFVKNDVPLRITVSTNIHFREWIIGNPIINEFN